MSTPTVLPNIEQDKLQASIENLKRTMSQQLELIDLIAQIHRAKFDAYRKQGFTDVQALELCSK